MPQALSAKSKQLTVFRLMAAYQFRNQIRRDDAESNSVPTKAERGVASWVLGRLADISKPDKTKVRQKPAALTLSLLMLVRELNEIAATKFNLSWLVRPRGNSVAS